MNVDPRLSTILAELRKELRRLYGPRLVELVLYGSQARSEARPYPDIDVMVVLAGEVDPAAEIECGGKVTAAISLEHDVVISSVYMPASRFRTDRNSPLLKNVHREGIRV